MNLVSFYPLYTDLDKIVQDYQCKRINIFLDLKNALMISLSIKNVYENMMESASKMGRENIMIFSSWLSLIDFYYNYMYTNNIDIHIYTIADSGEYLYHKAIYKDYKKNRQVTKQKTQSFLNENDMNYVNMNNIEKIMHASYYMYNTHKCYLYYTESDFVSHYVISSSNFDDSVVNLICSNDRDMLQTLKFPNTIQMTKHGSERKFITKDNWNEVYKIDNDLPVDKLIYMKSLMGDKGDYVPGIEGIGPKKAYTLVKELGDIESFEDFKSKVKTKVNDPKLGKWYRIVENNFDVVYRAFRLTNYEELIRSLSETKKKDIVQHSTDASMTLGQSKKFIDDMQNKISKYLEI